LLINSANAQNKILKNKYGLLELHMLLWISCDENKLFGIGSTRLPIKAPPDEADGHAITELACYSFEAGP
jgi:hypothetical protein